MPTPNRSPRVRIGLVAIALLLAFIVLIVQLVRWQVFDRNRVLPAEAAAIGEVQKRGPGRGIILDRTGEPLAMDVYRWEVWIQTSLVSPENAGSLSNNLAQVLGPQLRMPVDKLQQAIASREQEIIILTKHASEAVAEAISNWESIDRRGVGLLAVPMRYYPQRSLAAHLLGFVNDEPNAYYGVEQQYNDYLRSVDMTFLKTNQHVKAAYSQLPEMWQHYLPSEVGQDLVLTIDRRVQYLTEQALANAIGRYRAESGTIIIMDPQSGRILAMASLPAYDPNRYGTTNETVLIDPAISKQYEPGSVFKVITMAAGIDAGLVTADTILTDTQTLEYGDQIIQNWDRTGLGPITIREALTKSRNVVTAQVAIKLGESLFYQYVRRFGFGLLTEVDLGNESPGTVKVPGDPLWSQSDLATNSFGQGLAVTPIQLVTAVSAIANGGTLVQPRVVQAMIYRGQIIEPERTAVRRVIKQETADAVRKIMTDVVNDGTRGARIEGYTVAGKTGTAQVAIEGGYHPTQTIHSFVGFVPAEDPQLVFLVKLDKPKAYAWAESTAVPTFAELARQVLYLLNIPPSPVASLP